MKILYNLEATQPASGSKIHGGGNYGIVVFFELLKYDVEIECLVNSDKFLREDIVSALAEKGIKTYDTTSTDISELLANNKYDAFYSALTVAGVTIPERTRFIGTEHGLRELEMPNDWMMLRYKSSFKNRLKFIITALMGKRWKKVLRNRKRARLLNPKFEYVAVSEHTKYAILSNIPEIDPKRIQVFYSPAPEIDPATVVPYSNEKYVFLVSGNRPEKNVLRAVKAIDELISEYPQFNGLKVIIAGATKRSFRHKYANPDNFVFPGYVDESTLQSMYKGAMMFVYPSLNEGFGYPPIEAMNYGVPVLASPVTSIAEVCGDAALYFNPFDYKEIKGRVLRMLLSEETRAEYSHRGFKRYAEVSSRQKEDLKKMVEFIIGK